MKSFKLLLSSASLLFTFVAAFATPSITIDNTASDWDDVPMVTEPGESVIVKLYDDGSDLYVANWGSYFTDPFAGSGYVRYGIDADHNQNTYNSTNNWWGGYVGIDGNTSYSGCEYKGDASFFEVKIPHTNSNLNISTWGATLGVVLYESSSKTLPASGNRAYTYKSRTQYALADGPTMTAANAYYSSLMDYDVTDNLNFDVTKTELWAAWALTVADAGIYSVTANITAADLSTGYTFDLTLVNMATNAVVTTKTGTLTTTTGTTFDLDLGTWNLSDVADGNYMVKIKNSTTNTSGSLAVHSLTLTAQSCTTPTVTATQATGSNIVTLTSDDATIYYTTDGSTPDENATHVASPAEVYITADCTVKYFAKIGSCASDVEDFSATHSAVSLTCSVASTKSTIVLGRSATITVTATTNGRLDALDLQVNNTSVSSVTDGSTSLTYTFTPAATGTYTLTATEGSTSVTSSSLTISVIDAMATITIDGNSSDWATVPMVSEPGTTPITRLYDDGDNLYFSYYQTDGKIADPYGNSTYCSYVFDLDHNKSTGSSSAGFGGIDATCSYGSSNPEWHTFSHAKSATNDFFELQFPHDDGVFTRATVSWGSSFGIAMYYAYNKDGQVLAPASGNSAFTYKQRTTYTLADNLTMTAGNAYYSNLMAYDITDEDALDFTVAHTADNVNLWAAWDVTIGETGFYQIYVDATTSSLSNGYRFSLELVDMPTNPVVCDKQAASVLTEGTAAYVGTIYNTVPTGRYMLKIKNTEANTSGSLSVSSVRVNKVTEATALSDNSDAHISIVGADGQLLIRSIAPTDLRIYDTQGRLINTLTGVTHRDIALNAGVYIVATPQGTHKAVVR